MAQSRPRIGHNGGPSLDPGFAWRKHCWQKARAELIGQRLPLEVLRRRVARARDLGLAYPAYASILLGSGRDIVGFLYTCDALGLRLRRRLEIPAGTVARLAAQTAGARLAIAPEAEAPEPFRLELQEVSGLAFTAAGIPPRPSESWAAKGRRIRGILAGPGLPPKGVVLIGTTAEEAAWADAANLARFLHRDTWVAAPAG